MKKVIFTVIVLMCSQAYGLTLMGPPMAELEQGQKSAGVDFSYGEMDVEVSGLGITETFDDVESFSYLTNFGYGITDDWEAFIRLGIADIEAEDFDGSSEFAYGFGTKVTISQQDSLSWGGLFQITWAKSDDSVTGDIPGYGIVTADFEIDFYEIQIAVGPTYEADGISLYGGPFLHFIDGDLDVNVLGITGTLDFEQKSEFGGYVGLNAELTESANWQIEFQFTGDAYAICTGIGWKF